MKKGGILHPVLNRILSETGHTDLLTICDRGFPVPLHVERLDLALSDDIPSVLDVLRAVDKEFVIDTIIVADEMKQASPQRFEQLQNEFAHIRFLAMPHHKFKDVCQDSRVVIRTGDTTPYGNIMIISG